MNTGGGDSEAEPKGLPPVGPDGEAPSELEDDLSDDPTMTLGDATSAPAPKAAGADSLPIDPGRYRLGAFLGAGGMGEVFEANDSVLERKVALKFDRKGRDASPDFLQEARLQARLGHPNIPPVHDMMVDAEGRPFYAMHRIRGNSFKDILDERECGESEWTLPRLLALFQQVCLALDFAHAQGVLHLDVKPANIMLGEYGELYLVDWGLSEEIGRSEGESVRGSPAYMSPEQTRSSDGLTPASDVFSLGSLLYQIACGQTPFRGSNTHQLLDRLRAGSFVRDERWASTPIELQDIVQRALEVEPSSRYPSAREVHDEIQLYLEGTKERERKLREARASVAKGEEELERRTEALAEADRIEAKLTAPESWQSADEKREHWGNEDRCELFRHRAEVALERATAFFSEAQRLAPEADEVRKRLGRHLWERFHEAEEHGDGFQRRFFESQLRRLDLHEYERALRGDGRLSLIVDPPADRIRLWRLEDRDRCLQPIEPAQEFQGKAVIDPIPMGSYLVEIEKHGCRSLRAPVAIGREQEVKLNWTLRRDSEIGDGLVQIPPGSFVMGGDPDTFSSVSRQTRWVEEFFIAEYPVTWEEYREFLQSAADGSSRVDTDLEALLPTVVSDGAQTWHFEENEARWWRAEPNRVNRRRWPIFSIDYFSAQAYCEWRSQRDGRSYRLPTDAEWEKAARGVDARRFPWGNRYDASFCHNSGSSPDKAQPAPVGTYSTDVSPYGVRDLAGGVREWCAGWFDQRNDQCLVRGGSWNFGPIGAHCAYRMGCAPKLSFSFLGFRLALSPS